MTSSDDMLYCYLLDIVSHLQPLSHRCQLSFNYYFQLQISDNNKLELLYFIIFWLFIILTCIIITAAKEVMFLHLPACLQYNLKLKGKKSKASSLDIAPLTILNIGALQPRKWQLTGNDCSTAAQAVAAQSPR